MVTYVFGVRTSPASTRLNDALEVFGQAGSPLSWLGQSASATRQAHVRISSQSSGPGAHTLHSNHCPQAPPRCTPRGRSSELDGRARAGAVGRSARGRARRDA